jgi:hypothetical protein
MDLLTGSIARDLRQPGVTDGLGGRRSSFNLVLVDVRRADQRLVGEPLSTRPRAPRSMDVSATLA